MQGWNLMMSVLVQHVAAEGRVGSTLSPTVDR
jgi:hypothetical protein